MHIVLLRGLAREAAHWLDFPQTLRHALGNEAQLHCLDFPGCGAYHQQAALGSIGAMTDDARAQLALRGITQPVYVVGISMGGMIALDWAQRFPEQVAGIALINSSTGDQPLHWRLRLRAWPAIISALLLPMEWRERLVLGKVSNDRERFALHLQQWLQIQRERPVSRASILTMLGAAARFRPQPHCPTPGLVIASTADRFVDYRASQDVAQRFDWPLQLHSSAGHDLPLDDPAWLSEQLGSWIKTLRNHPYGQAL